MDIADYILRRLDALHLSQKEFAEKLNRDPSTVSNWLRKRQPIPLDMLDAIAAALEERTPVRLYEAAGLLAKLPGGELIKMLDGESLEDVLMVEALARTYLKKNHNQPKLNTG